MKSSQNAFEEAFLKAVRSLLPSGLRPVLLADRGFGRTTLFQFLKHLGWSYVIRVKGDVMVDIEGKMQLLADIPLRLGQRKFYQEVAYRQDKAMRVNLVLAWQGEEPWYLATDLDDPALAIKLYKKRMSIEEFFRDCKRELGMREAQVRQAHRLDSLLMGLLIAYLLVAVVGLGRAIRGFKAKVLTRGKASFIWVALQFLKQPPPNALTILRRALGVQSG